MEIIVQENEKWKLPINASMRTKCVAFGSQNNKQQNIP